MIRGPDFSKDIPAGVVRTIMLKADLDESGYLEYPEFIAMVSVFRFFKLLDIIFLSLCFVSKILDSLISVVHINLFLMFRSIERTCRVYSDTSCSDMCTL